MSEPAAQCPHTCSCTSDMECPHVCTCVCPHLRSSVEVTLGLMSTGSGAGCTGRGTHAHVVRRATVCDDCGGLLYDNRYRDPHEEAIR